VRPAQTARSERTREALRRAALVRFLAQGVEGTSPEQIAGDAGVSVRTFYRHFTSKHDLLFADYDAGLHWFRSALAARPDDEPITESVRVAVLAFPYDVQAVTQIAVMRSGSLDADRIVQHMRQVEADFAEAVAGRLERRPPPRTGARERDSLGERLAERVRARHRVVVDLLLAVGVPAEAAEQDAEGIEHHVSDATLAAFAHYLRRPS